MTVDDVIAVIDLYDQETSKAMSAGDLAGIQRIGDAFHQFAAMQPLAYELTGESGGNR